MKTNKKLLLAVLAAFALAGCTAPTSTNATVVQLENPNNIGKAAQAGIQIAATAFLGRNPTYADELVAAANTLVAIGKANPATITSSDIAAFVKNTPMSGDTKAEVTSYATSALALFVSSFNTQFPTLKPNYQLYIYAVANGLYLATGHADLVVALPVVPWPPVSVPPVPVPVTGA